MTPETRTVFAALLSSRQTAFIKPLILASSRDSQGQLWHQQIDQSRSEPGAILPGRSTAYRVTVAHAQDLQFQSIIHHSNLIYRQYFRLGRMIAGCSDRVTCSAI
jgi:hypothetical protein